MQCNQICRWNDPSDGCIKPIHAICRMSNIGIEKQTNADRIRAMSDEELAEYLIQYRDDWGDYCTPNCEFYDTYEEAKKATIKWLKQPAEEVTL